MVAGPGYKYKEVARKRAEREAMLGVECPDCQRFYEACQTWNSIAPAALPKCGHAVQGRRQRECIMTGDMGVHYSMLPGSLQGMLAEQQHFSPAVLLSLLFLSEVHHENFR